MTRRPAVFLDRDGTVMHDTGYMHRPDQVELIPGAAAAIAALNALAIPVIVVTNQSGVARGLYAETDVAAVNAELVRQLAAHAAHVTAIYHCPHHPTEGVPPYRLDCRCRKPHPGLLERAVAAFHLDPARSLMVGDRVSDVDAGLALGTAAALVRTGYGAEATDIPDAAVVVPDLAAAVDWWLSAR